MPFTFAHPAAVLPMLSWRWVSWTGLILGSMMPDFEYFLRLRLTGEYGHTWWGILYFDLPLGILLAIVFHAFVKHPLVRNSPDILRSRWTSLASLDFWAFFRTRWIVVLYSLVIGAFTHVLWDSITHNDTVIVNNLPFLKTQISLYFEEYPLYHLLQHASTGIGLIFVGRFILRLPRENVTSGRDRGFWGFIAVLNFLISGSLIYRMSLIEEVKIGHVVVIGLGGFLYSLILVCLALRLISRVKPVSG